MITNTVRQLLGDVLRAQASWQPILFQLPSM